MSAQYLFIQLDERQDAEKRSSYNMTFVELNDKGLVVAAPITIWQREDFAGEIPPTLPFVAEVDVGFRQFRGKDGMYQTQPVVRQFIKAKPVKIM